MHNRADRSVHDNCNSPFYTLEMSNEKATHQKNL